MRRWTALIPVLAAALALPGCLGGGDNPPSNPDELVIRSYDVPEGVEGRTLLDMVNGLLGPRESSLGSARLYPYPDGRLVVTAPASLQAGIADLIAEMKAGPRKAKEPPAALAIRYWVLLARPTAGQPSVAANLQDDPTVKTAIDEIVAAQGPMEFALLEGLRLGVVEGQEALIRGRRVSVDQKVTRTTEGGSLAEIEIGISGAQGRPNSLRTWARLDPGKIVVLGQAAFNPSGVTLPAGWGGRDDITVYFVIASERE